MIAVELPRMRRIRQKYPPTAPLDIPRQFRRSAAEAGVLDGIRPGASVAVGVGSRGITDIRAVVQAVVKLLRERGAEPFILPAMGSHGGATPEGQRRILESYGITEAALGVPVRASMATRSVGVTAEGWPVHVSAEALDAGGLVVVNRIKPHTDFGGDLGSGLVKMMVVGLGKLDGAAAFHRAAARHGHLAVLKSVARTVAPVLPLWFGVGIVEGTNHATVRLEVLPPETLIQRESALLKEAAQHLARLPFDDVDLLIVDRIGKDISGAGMDPNVTGRMVTGYHSSLDESADASPRIRRIFVRDLTPGTHGNAIGIGMADFTTTRLVRAMDPQITYTNCVTALSVQAAKVPIHFDSDRETLCHALASLGLEDVRAAKILRISDTLSLETVQVSEAYEPHVRRRVDLEVLGELQPMTFGEAGNLSGLM